MKFYYKSYWNKAAKLKYLIDVWKVREEDALKIIVNLNPTKERKMTLPGIFI